MRYSEHGEEKIILGFFENHENRIVLEAGARNGVRDSNSRCLIAHYGWKGILCEPDPRQFTDLEALYGEDENITLLDDVLFNINKEIILYLSQDSGSHPKAGHNTTSEAFKSRAEKLSGVIYPKKIVKNTKTLSQVFDKFGLKKIDYISIDCEGVDYEVISGINFDTVDISMISFEPSIQEKQIRDLLERKGYVFYDSTWGNVFYVKR